MSRRRKYRAIVRLLESVLRRLLRSTSREVATAPWGDRRPAKAWHGRAGAPTPDMDALVTDAEIEAVTGGKPVGEPRRNGPDGSETDLGRLVIRESQLSNGDEFLITLGNCSDRVAAQLGMARLDDVEKPLDGVGERGLLRVKRYVKEGTSEIGVTALKGNFTLSLTHSSSDGKTDHQPLTDLLRIALTRL